MDEPSSDIRGQSNEVSGGDLSACYSITTNATVRAVLEAFVALDIVLLS